MNAEVEGSKLGNKYKLVSAVFAFVLWGGWAYIVNCKNDVLTGLSSGITQGTASFIITLFLVRAVTFLFPRFQRRFTQLLCPAIITVSFTGPCLVLIHTIMGTPAILYTISPALVVAFSFCIFTALKLQKNTERGL